MTKMTLKVKVNDLHFQYQPRVSQGACLVQIWWFQLKYVMSYRADKVKFTDRRTDRRRQRQYPFQAEGVKAGAWFKAKHVFQLCQFAPPRRAGKTCARAEALAWFFPSDLNESAEQEDMFHYTICDMRIASHNGLCNALWNQVSFNFATDQNEIILSQW